LQVVLVSAKHIDVRVRMFALVPYCTTERGVGTERYDGRVVELIFECLGLVIRNLRKLLGPGAASPDLYIQPSVAYIERIGAHGRKRVGKGVFDGIDGSEDTHQGGNANSDDQCGQERT